MKYIESNALLLTLLQLVYGHKQYTFWSMGLCTLLIYFSSDLCHSWGWLKSCTDLPCKIHATNKLIGINHSKAVFKKSNKQFYLLNL